MSGEDWLQLLARIVPHQPTDIDDFLAPDGLPVQGGPPALAEPDGPPPSPRLWRRTEAGRSYLGVRVSAAPPADLTGAALRLASAAAERGVIPIILTTLPQTGFEVFGFRVERLSGATEADRSRCEAELQRFWNLAIIIDLAEIAALG